MNCPFLSKRRNLIRKSSKPSGISTFGVVTAHTTEYRNENNNQNIGKLQPGTDENQINTLQTLQISAIITALVAGLTVRFNQGVNGRIVHQDDSPNILAPANRFKPRFKNAGYLKA